MIIVRSPLRISFAGGGTDIPQFYENYGPGVVVSTSINRYVYLTLTEKFDGKISVRYRVHENVDTVEELKHPLIRAILKSYGIRSGVELVFISEVPAKGSGLGASSALACALIAALDRYTGVCVHGQNEHDEYKRSVAERASKIEIGIGSPIGKQDHYASALGGFNLLKFMRNGSVETEAFESHDFIGEIESQSMLFYLDIEHQYSPETGNFVQTVLRDQVATMSENHRSHQLQRDNAVRMWEHLAYEVPERFMDHINENWRIKRSLHKDISNQQIDGVIQKAMAAGATAAKVCGAGGGGFVYFMVPPSMQDNVRRALKDYRELRFCFESSGVEVIYDGELRRHETFN